MPQTAFTTAGYWALGVVVIYLATSVVWRTAHAAGDYIHDLGEEMQMLFGRILFGTFALSLIYLLFWGCYMIGERMSAFIGSLA